MNHSDILMNFPRNYVRFTKTETEIIPEQEYDKLTNRQDTMGLEQLLLKTAKQEGREEGREEGRLEKDSLVVNNLLRRTSFSDAEIARLVGVDINFVAQLRDHIAN